MMAVAGLPSKLLDGWGAIAAVLTDVARVEISVFQAMRLASRPSNPLPVRKLSPSSRRIVGDPHLVRQWAEREYGVPLVRSSRSPRS